MQANPQPVGCEDLLIGISSCPNDTYIFHALLHGLVSTAPLSFRALIDDVESLNQRAFLSELPVTKLSFHAFMKLRDRYDLLDSGAAFGFGCGPLVIAREAGVDLSRARIAVPGLNTTACMLLKSWRPDATDIHPMRFDRILPALRDGQVDAGVVIHEGRFVFESYNCECLIDLGEWWEAETSLPIPLGCIAIRKDPKTLAYKQLLESSIRNSLLYAQEHPGESRAYIRSLAGELDDEVVDAHIELYVNEFSISLGEEGRRVMQKLEKLVDAWN